LSSGGDPLAATVLRYFDPGTERIVEREVRTEADVLVTVRAARSLRGSRGTPALEVQRADGSSLSVAYEGERATLVWVDALGEPFHSVGSDGGLPLIYDYFGSWSEAPAAHCVPASAATTCLAAFALRGRLGEEFLFEPG
jgi:hypothetical protein